MANRYVYPLVAVALFVLASPVIAQTDPDRSTAQINGALDAFFGDGGTMDVSPAEAGDVDPVQYEFTYDPAITAATHAEFTKIFAPDGNPGSIAAATEFLAQMTPEFQQQIMDEGFDSQGWKANNLSDIVAATVITSFSIVQDIAETTPEQDIAIRDLFRVAFDGTPLATQANADKQKVGELLLLTTIVSVIQYQTAVDSGDQASLAVLKSGSRDVLTSFGLHPSLFVLGPEGLAKSPRLIAAEAKIADGSATFESEFPEVVADYARLGVNNKPALPTFGGETATAVDTTTTAGNTETTATTQEAPAIDTNAVNPLGLAPADPVLGSYLGDGLELTLSGETGSYLGDIVFQGQTMPVRATGNAAQLNGTFKSGENTFDLMMVLQGDVLTLTTGGKSYALTRTAAANPLGGN